MIKHVLFRFVSNLAVLRVSLLIFVFGLGGLLGPAIQFSCGQTYKETIGYNALVDRYGSGLDDGSGIVVAQPEANTGTSGEIWYMPDAANAQFTGKTITDGTGTSTGTSGHATTTVGHYFYGNTLSIAPGITEITGYEAGHWINSRLAPGGAGTPLAESFRVSNHSYVARAGNIDVPTAEDLLRRMDFYINQNGTTVVVGADNGGTSALPRLFSQGYNSIAVGRSDGAHSHGLSTLYGTGRVKPDLVAPLSTTSRATAVVSSAAALLHEKADNLGSFAADARRSEVIKSVLMAGATKEPFEFWERTTTRPLDEQFGAGQLNIYNSYNILDGGSFDGSLTEPTSQIGFLGWDYENSLAGNDTSLYYELVVGQGGVKDLSVMLNWNMQVSDTDPGEDFVASTQLADLSLSLWDSSGSFLGQLVDTSNSPVDNVEHLYLDFLSEGLYTLQVSNHADFSSSYAISWRMTAIPEPGSGGVLFFLITTWLGAARLGRRR